MIGNASATAYCGMICYMDANWHSRPISFSLRSMFFIIAWIGFVLWLIASPQTNTSMASIATSAIAGVAIAIVLLLKVSGFPQVLVFSISWQVIPTAAWIFFAWSSPSVISIVSGFIALIIVPAIVGVFARSWMYAFTCAAVSFVSYGLTIAVFMVLMGDGR